MAAAPIPSEESPDEGDAATAASAHLEAKFIWQVLRDRGVADKRLVAIALDRRLGSRIVGPKQELAFQALCVYMDLHEGKFPGASAWDKWRVANPEFHHLPCTTAISKAFAGWSNARAACAQDGMKVDVLARRLLAHGPAFSRERLLELVVLFGGSRVGPLDSRHFLKWLKAEAPAPAPSSFGPYRRMGWKWADVLEEAGFGHRLVRRSGSEDELAHLIVLYSETTDDEVLSRKGFMDWWREADLRDQGDVAGIRPRASLLREVFETWGAALSYAGLTERAPVRGRGGGKKQRSESELERLLVWPRRAGEELGPEMSVRSYRRWRAKTAVEVEAMGEPSPDIPTVWVLSSVFGAWHDVKLAAGVPGIEDCEPPEAPRKYTEEEVREAVLGAIADDGPQVTATAFTAWRDRERAKASKLGRVARIPDIELVRQQLGGRYNQWAVAKQTALAWQETL